MPGLREVRVDPRRPRGDDLGALLGQHRHAHAALTVRQHPRRRPRTARFAALRMHQKAQPVRRRRRPVRSSGDAADVRIVLLALTPVHVAARQRPLLALTQRHAIEADVVRKAVREVVVLRAAAHREDVQQVAAGTVPDQRQRPPVGVHAERAVHVVGVRIDHLHSGHPREHVEAAAAVVLLARELPGLIHQHKLMSGRLLRPANLRVRGAKAVAEIVRQFVALAEVVDVEVIEVAVVEHRAVAQQDRLRLRRVRRAQKRDPLLPHDGRLGDHALKVLGRATIGFGDVARVEEQPAGVTRGRAGSLDIAIGQPVDERAEVPLDLRVGGAVVDALGEAVVAGVEGPLLGPRAARIRCAVTVARPLPRAVHRQTRQHEERAEGRVVVEVQPLGIPLAAVVDQRLREGQVETARVDRVAE